MTRDSKHYSKQELLQYLNIELLLDDMRSIEDHLDKCDSCMEMLKELEPDSNKNERDRFFDDTTELIRATKLRSTNPQRQRIAFYISAIILVIAIGGWAINKFDIFPKTSQQSSTSLNNDYSPIASSLDDNNGLLDSTVMTEDSLVDFMPVSQSEEADLLRNNTMLSDPVELTVEKPTSNEMVADSIENSDEVISQPILEKQDSMVSESDSLASEVIQVEKSEQEAPIVENSGTIEVVANSKNQAIPEDGYGSYNQYIKNNHKYPDDAKSKNLQGDVVVQFRVTIDGNITDLQIISGLSADCDNLVKSIIQNGPKWKSFIGEDFVEYRSAILKFTFKI